jgi:phenylpropionate dioxygenase-like ring-hydroxylating dioxygenase large terminal subunit
MTQAAEILAQSLTIGAEAYTSADYAAAERDRLWRKTWLQVGRVEEIAEVGNFLTYEILDDSVIITRTAPDAIRASYNVCSHRGRWLIDTPAGKRNAVGKKMNFVCGFRGTQPNPSMESSVASLRYNPAKYMGVGAPQPVKVD